MKKKYEDYLNSFISLEKKSKKKYFNKHYNLDSFRTVLASFDNPHSGLSIIHVAGTKGKGSTVTYLDYFLSLFHFRCGTFTSPHLEKINERIKINSNPIPDKDMEFYLDFIKQKLADMNNIKRPTWFELITLIALLYFKDQKCHYVILEVGLGGRLDCTNVVIPHVSVITGISYDHMEYLGNSLKKIALEKCGIIKKQIPVVSAKQRFFIKNIIRKKAKDLNCQFFYAMNLFYYELLKADRSEISLNFILKFQKHFWKNREIDISEKNKATYLLNNKHAGIYQIDNILTALSVLVCLNIDIFKLLGKLQVKKSNQLRYIKLDIINQGKFEIINKQPLIILDVAHNARSSLLLNKSLKYYFQKLIVKNHYKIIFLLGLNKGKDVNGFIQKMFKKLHKIIITNTTSVKGSEGKALYEKLQVKYKNVEYIENRVLAFQECVQNLKKNHILIVTGSFYLCGPFKNWFHLNKHQFKI